MTYNGSLSELCISEENEGASSEPSRFTDFDLNERKVSYGSVGYALQFMLNPSLSDVDRFPLKLGNIIVQSVDPDVAPEKLVWAKTPDLEWDSLPNVGLRGDRYYRPMKVVGDMIPYTGSVMSIDPSGRGSDETGYAVVKMLNGTLYVPEAGGLKGGYDQDTLMELVNIAKRNKVNAVITESNFGDGMFNQLITPIFTREYPVTLEEVRHHTQKEKRIIDTLEPLLGGHKLVIDPTVIENDYKTAQSYPPEQHLHYMLFYQMTRLTNRRGSIRHDDRLDALSIACNYWVTQMAQDADRQIKERKRDLVDEELNNFKDMYYKRKTKSSATWF